MKALVFNKIGNPLMVLHHTDIPIPEINDNQVLIKVIYSVINPADILFISGRYRHDPVFPQVAGVEGVGEVVDIGNNVIKINIGDTVSFRTRGAWADYAIANEKFVYRVPNEFDLKKASLFSLSPMTAYGLIDIALKMSNSQNSLALFTSPKTTITRLALEFSKLYDIESHYLVEENGLFVIKDSEDNHIIMSSSNYGELINNTSRKYDVIFDSLGGNITPVLHNLLMNSGLLISYGFFHDVPFEISSRDLIYKNSTILGFGIDNWINRLSKSELNTIQSIIWSRLKEQSLLKIDSVYNISQIDDALDKVINGLPSGKVLLSI